MNNPLSVCRLSKAADLDHHWVAKAWLSDVGLPQYSQAFHTHLVDGRMLNSLTRRDLERHLNITKKFHQVSLLLGIELLQSLDFNKEVSKKKSFGDESAWMCSGRKQVVEAINWVKCVSWNNVPGAAGSSDTVWAPEWGSARMDVSSRHEMD